jgi:hypothetical protein
MAKLLKEKPTRNPSTNTNEPMANTSTYQRQKEIDSLFKRLDKGQRSKLLELLLEEEVASWPAKAKEYGVTAKAIQRLEWLKEHWGTQFEVEKNGTTTKALRKMPLTSVIELLTSFCLGVVDSEDEVITFGSLDLQNKLVDKVASGLSALNQSTGAQVTIPLAAYRDLQRLRREAEAAGADPARTSTAILERIDNILKAMPSVKDEAETASYQKRRLAYDRNKEAKALAFTA